MILLKQQIFARRKSWQSGGDVNATIKVVTLILSCLRMNGADEWPRARARSRAEEVGREYARTFNMTRCY